MISHFFHFSTPNRRHVSGHYWFGPDQNSIPAWLKLQDPSDSRWFLIRNTRFYYSSKCVEPCVHVKTVVFQQLEVWIKRFVHQKFVLRSPKGVRLHTLLVSTNKHHLDVQVQYSSPQLVLHTTTIWKLSSNNEPDIKRDFRHLPKCIIFTTTTL